MSILSSDPISQACEPLGKYYEVCSAFTAGGICPNSLRDHVAGIPVLPGIKLDVLKGFVNRVLEEEAEDYIKRWHTRECEGEAKIETDWTKDLFSPRRMFVNVSVNGRKWMSISITEYRWSDPDLQF